METKIENLSNPVSLGSLNWRQLSPGMVFWVICERGLAANNPELFGEIWQFEVMKQLPSKEVAKVVVVFPSGKEHEMFFEEAEIVNMLRVYFDSEKNGSWVDWNIIDILLWN